MKYNINVIECIIDKGFQSNMIFIILTIIYKSEIISN